MTDKPDTNLSPAERYTVGNETASRVMAQRNAQTRASFLQPYLSAGMNLLDAGCGPGSITVGLAEMVSPGHVTGIDLSDVDVERAKKLAARQGTENVGFQVASIYQIPFPDNTFDATFVHGVLEHLNNPISALAEMRRVLRPGGVIGAAMSDFSGQLFAPADPILRQSLDVWHKIWQHGGGDPFAGKHIRRFMREAGFARVEGSSSVICFASIESVRIHGSRFVDTVRHYADEAIERGLADDTTIHEMIAAWQNWGNDPDGFWSTPWGQAVGWKE